VAAIADLIPKNEKRVIFEQNFVWNPYIKVFQKTQKYFLNDQQLKLPNQSENGSHSSYGS
jgi:hypothetical protein